MSEKNTALIQAAIMIVIAVFVGLLFADSISYILGTNTEINSDSDFSDRLSLVKNVYIEQNESFWTSAMYLYEEENLELIASQSGVVYVRLSGGELIPASEYYADSAEMQQALSALFIGESTVLSDAVDTLGEKIEDVRLYNIKTIDDQVLYIYYYLDGGYIGVIYDHSDRIDDNFNIIRLSEQWGILSVLVEG